MKKHSFWITILLVAVFSLVSQGAWAGGGHSTHYGKVTVSANGNGTVYIGTSNTSTSGNTPDGDYEGRINEYNNAWDLD